MIIKLIQQTRYNGIPVYPEDTFEVNESTGERWVKNGIAVVVEEENKEVDPATLNAKQLYKLCIEKGLEVAEKQPKEVYLEALQNA